MSSSRSALRRSRRAPPKKQETFQVGQIVEMQRFNEEVMKVKLTQLLTEGSTTMHPRWLVLFPDDHMEEVYEHRFGKIISRAPGEEDVPDSRRSSASNSPVPPSAAPLATEASKTIHKKTSSASPSNSSGKNSPSSETDPDGKKKSVSFHHHHQGESDGGDDSASNNIKNKSAREERSRRRQAMIDEVPPGLTIAPAVSNPTLKRKNSSNSKSGGSSNKNKRQRQEASSEEPVTKVKFLTGTLYLYRGRHRRAEFVRRV